MYFNIYLLWHGILLHNAYCINFVVCHSSSIIYPADNPTKYSRGIHQLTITLLTLKNMFVSKLRILHDLVLFLAFNTSYIRLYQNINLFSHEIFKLRLCSWQQVFLTWFQPLLRGSRWNYTQYIRRKNTFQTYQTYFF